jgi:hypothetical protein
MNPFELILDCRYHTQDLTDSCGAAVALMISRFLKLPYSNLDQKNDRNTLKQSTAIDGVITSPAALGSFLNQKNDLASFVDKQSSSFEELNRQIIQSLLFRRTPVAVTVFAAGHWIIVDGFQTSADPGSGNPYSLGGVWIHNPVENGDGSPPPHSDNDDCGSGIQDTGVEKEFVTARQWRLLTTATQKSPFKVLQLASVFEEGSPSVMPPNAEVPTASSKPLSGDEAVTVAKQSFSDYNLLQHTHYSGNLNTDTPHLVTGPEDQGGDYYIIPWRDNMGFRAFSLVNMNGGYLMSAAFTGQPVQRYLLPDDTLFASLSSPLKAKFKYFGLANPLSEQDVRTGMATRSLEWRPSRESLSPYYPFYKIPIGRGGKCVFMDQSGVIHKKLTNPAAGG